MKYVTIHGVTYKKGCCIRLKEIEEYGCSDFLLYGCLQEVIVYEDAKFFIVEILQTLSFESHYMSYKVVMTNEQRVILPQGLPRHGVLYLHSKGEEKYIVEKDTVFVEYV